MLPLKYEGDIFRPPSEAGSLIIQATIGCSHNRCSFCAMYKRKKFRERAWGELEDEITQVSGILPHTRRVFLADGNAMTIAADKLQKILEALNRSFPLLERVSVYSNPRDLLEKEPAELSELRRLKLGMVYLGVESGSEVVLQTVKKGASPKDILLGAKRVKQAGIPLSVTIINGLAGLEGSAEHAAETAKLLNEIDPDYLGLLSLMTVPGTTMHRRIQEASITPLGPWEMLREIKLMVEALSLTHCVFRANHASNYLPLKAVLSRDREKLLAALEQVLQKKAPDMLRHENYRML